MNTPITKEADAKSNLLLGKEATSRLLAGIKIATQAIRSSYGPKGVNGILESEFYPYHIVANDCETILQSIKVYDPFEKVGFDVLKELSSKANKDSGDGRKTTCIIAEEIIERGFNLEDSGVGLKDELDALIPLIEKQIDEQKQTITPEEVHKVAAISGESREIGDTLGEIYKVIGKDGIIDPEASGTYTTSYTFVEGIRFTGTGYLSPYMVHDEEAEKDGRKPSTAVYKRPVILVTKRRIGNLDEINPLLEKLTVLGKRDLVIFTDDMDSNVASVLVKAHREGVFNITIVKAPVLWKGYVFEDFAKVVGATIVEDASGVNFKNLRLDHLGTCEKIVIDEDEVRVIGGNDITEHINTLKSRDDNDSKLRLSWLTAKRCLLKIGANNESELSYKRLKYYDAINSSKLALRDGIVAGGGSALAIVAANMPETPAGKLIKSAFEAPFLQITANAGCYFKFEPSMLIDGKIPGHGFDVKNKEWCNMFERGIIDSSAVVKNAVRNAISLASTVLTGRILTVIGEKSPTEVKRTSVFQ